MIIFGTRTLQRNKGQGQFHCPRCSMQRGYRQISADRFFTLYFIPLIPLGSAGRYVECMSCGGTYGEEVLTYNPQVERAELVADIRRTLILVLRATQRADAVHVAALQSVLGEIFDEEIPENEIWNDLRLADQANAQLVPFVQQRLASFNAKGKELVLAAAARMLTGGRMLVPADREVVGELAIALGFTRGTAQSLLPAP
jgi:hypothetical protein